MSRTYNRAVILNSNNQYREDSVDHKQRHKRLRLLVSKVNKARKVQSKKIDILCNDIIATQREFIKRLNTISFTANFYESIVGTTDLSSLLAISGKLIKSEIPDANIAFFLRPLRHSVSEASQTDNFELHLFESDQPITLEKQHIENCFTAELVDNICKSNKLCTLDDLFAIGLQGNLSVLNKTSVVTVPLGQFGTSVGFVLIYRAQSQNKLTAEELTNISAIAPGLSRAIQSCRLPIRGFAAKEYRS